MNGTSVYHEGCHADEETLRGDPFSASNDGAADTAGVESNIAGRIRNSATVHVDDLAAAPRADGEIVSDFRNFLLRRFGDAVVRVLDHRIEDGGDTKDLVGTAPGLESAYKVKRAVSQLKDAIRMFAAGDPELSRRLDGLFAQQQMTFDRRFGRMAGVSGRR